MNRLSAQHLRRLGLALAPHGWFGLFLISVAWPLNWALPGLRTHLLFFPLWLGYALAVDALVLRRRGTSILTRSRRDFALLFVYSAPAWWLFEVFNWRTQNWEYLGSGRFDGLTYFVLTTLSFSTVMPAVFETAELVRSATWMRHLSAGPRLGPTRPVLLAMLGIGFAMVALSMSLPGYFYPFLWGSAFFLAEPVNAWLGRPSLLGYLQRGDWRPVAALALGALVCGFFWEFWNFYSYPKWTYHTPGVEFLHVFEMPLLGFLGYPPFGLELYALAHLIAPRPPRLRL
ncbi:MAG: hypothetical protein M3151_13230 [Actinomycetota bacterium]|nr:hypothetical protein [Actinomycetota bacterium]